MRNQWMLSRDSFLDTTDSDVDERRMKAVRVYGPSQSLVSASGLAMVWMVYAYDFELAASDNRSNFLPESENASSTHKPV